MRIARAQGHYWIVDSNTLSRIEGHQTIQDIITDFPNLRTSSETISNLDQFSVLECPAYPSKIVCVGRNYQEHIAEMGGEEAPVHPPKPLLFLKPPSSLIGPGEKIIIPKESSQIQHEIELGIIIGKTARRVDSKEAEEFIFAYTIFIDVTARDLQAGDQTWFRGKCFDTFAPLGPWMVTKDEIDNPQDLSLRLWVNGDLRHDGHTSHMIFNVFELISHISDVVTLFPGDVIATGTPSGVGDLEPGDKVESEIEKIGKMTNFVE